MIELSPTPNTGGSAFPLYNHGTQTLGLNVTGMTLRDYFAAKAMQSAYLHFSAEAEVTKHWTTEGLAESAYAMADAMLKARTA